jgi:hypothetical protein
VIEGPSGARREKLVASAQIIGTPPRAIGNP